MLFSTIFVFLQEKAYAQDAFRGYCTILHSGCGEGGRFVATLADRIGQFFAMLIGGVAVLAIIYGSIRLIISGGNDQGKEEAKKIIITAVIGLILALAAEGIILFVQSFVQVIPGT